jgi:hypothetical protein
MERNRPSGLWALCSLLAAAQSPLKPHPCQLGARTAEAPILPLTYEREHLLIKPWISYYPTTASRAVFWKDVVIAPRA